jgi:integrase
VDAGRGQRIGGIVTSYIRWLEEQGAPSARTARHQWATASGFFDDREAIDQHDVDVFVSRRRAAGISDETIRRQLGILRAALRRHERSGGSRAPLISLPPPGRPRERKLSREELSRLVEACEEPHVRLAVEILAGTGLRVGRVLALKWADVDLRRGEIRLETRRRAKGAPRVLPLPRTLIESLRASERVCDHVVAYDGRPVASIRRGFRTACDRAGLGPDVVPHTIRHSVATILLDEGVPLTVVSQLLGHSSSLVTERVYARHTAQALAQATRRLER